MALRLQQLVPLDLAGSVTQEVHHRRPGGPATWLQVTLSFVFDEATARQYVVAIFEDINERKRAASALREARDRLASIVSSSPMPIWTLDATGVFTTMNAAAREIFGMRFVDSSRPLPIAATDEVQRALLARVLSGETIRDHEMNFSRNDGRVAYLAVSQTPLRDAEGAITGVLAVAADISERKSAAETLRMMNADLERRVAERTADLQAANREMEAFTYSVSHDLRAPVRAIEGFTNLLISDHGAPMEGAAGNLMLRVRGAAQRMERLIDGLLALSRTSRQRMHAERTDLSALARDVVAELREQAPQREVQVTIEDGLQVDGDSRFLRQALENLLGNAWKYTSMNASAHIEFGARGDGAGALEYFVRDDGAGFDMRYAAKLFTPFERLHSESEFPGVGVGLATVQRVIARHGGTIRGEGAPGAGAAFYFTLGRVAD
jgi:PAS domain S-box-containing protein